MVLPMLKPDILRRVVDFALESCTIPNDDPASHLERQGCLANLILVSKIFKEICTPQLYKDCLVSNVNKFLYKTHGDPNSEKLNLLCNIKTLRIYHSNDHEAPSYFDLVAEQNRWNDIGCRKDIITGISSRKRADVTAFEYQDTFLAATRFLHGPRHRHDLFGALDRICMTTTGDQSWGARPEHYDLVAKQTAVLPNVLLRLSGVQHYCQTSMLGPLAIHNTFHKVKSPPRIVTFHSPIHNGSCDPEMAFPIVLGSINRYMSTYPAILHMVEDGNLAMAGGISLAFELIIESLERSRKVVAMKFSTIHPIDFDTVSR